MAEFFKVLVVDDEAGMRSGVSRVLNGFSVNLPETGTDANFTVIEAETAEDGLKIIESQKPDVLLLDHKLPGISGLELLTRIAEKKIDILAIMMTAYASLETAIEATKNGAYDFLAKPFSPTELKHMIRKSADRIIYQRQARDLAEEKKKLRFQFISILAHELKSPLDAIQGYLNIINDRILGDDIAVYKNVIDRSLVRLDGMKKLIFDLLDMTRIESEQRKREFTDIDICETAKKSIETCILAAKERNISVNLDAKEKIIIKGDVFEIETILNNLISNAIKYNIEKGKVDIKIKSDEQWVVISVRDTGIGFKDEEKNRIFRDFVRIKNEKTRNILGSGLGLSTVKKLVDLNNGTITVESEFAKGSCFTVKLLKNLQDNLKQKNESKPDNILVKTERAN